MTMAGDSFDLLFGNEELKALLRGRAASRTIPHACLLEGPQGSGKHTLATAIACALTETESGRRKIAEGICPDVAVITAAKDRLTIGVDIIRALREDAYIAPNDLDFKVYILERTDAMTVQAQNALLKLLEEPPEAVYFLLLCENASALLPTIRSRTAAMKLQVFSCETLAGYMRQSDAKAAALYAADPAAFDHIIRAADGTVGRAKKLFSSRKASGSGKTAEGAVWTLLRAIASRHAFEVLNALNALPDKREELSETLLETRTAVRDLILCKARMLREGESGGGAGLLYLPGGEETGELAARFSLTELLRMEAELEDARTALAANVNVQTEKLYLCSRLTSPDA